MAVPSLFGCICSPFFTYSPVIIEVWKWNWLIVGLGDLCVNSGVDNWVQRLIRRLRIIFQGRLQCFEVALPLIEGKCGIEIGGKSELFRGWNDPSRNSWLTPMPIYSRVGSLDNCNFSAQTIWGVNEAKFRFSPWKASGKVIIAEGSNLANVPDNSYDFVLSCHNLEHFANPVKALMEWKRITRPEGGLVVVLPDYRRTFDHRRRPTTVTHMLEDYSLDVQEDDATHIAELLLNYDLALDVTLKTHTLEELRERCSANISNRCMHHHVFDEVNSRELFMQIGLDVLAVELAFPCHIFLIARWRN
jgi:SAM-dependent methyltransferase